MRVAIIGSGIAGLATAHLRCRDHEITLFESDSRVGGHVHTVKVESKHGTINIDTGFIVYNERNYPNFVKLIQELDIQTQPSSMSFSVRLANPDLEYNGSTLRQLFVDKRNLFRPWFYKMLRDILRFNRMAPDAIDGRPTNWSLRDLLDEHGFSQPFIEYYLVPMGAAIWSTPVTQVLDIPARFFIQFFENHGMLTVDDRPEWRVIKCGSCHYVKEIMSNNMLQIRKVNKKYDYEDTFKKETKIIINNRNALKKNLLITISYLLFGKELPLKIHLCYHLTHFLDLYFLNYFLNL